MHQNIQIGGREGILKLDQEVLRLVLIFFLIIHPKYVVWVTFPLEGNKQNHLHTHFASFLLVSYFCNANDSPKWLPQFELLIYWCKNTWCFEIEWDCPLSPPTCLWVLETSHSTRQVCSYVLSLLTPTAVCNEKDELSLSKWAVM